MREAMRLPCIHALHTRRQTRYVAPVPCAEPRHDSRMMLECVAGEDSDSHERAKALGGMNDEQGPESRSGRHFGWSQGSLWMADPLDRRTLGEVKHWFATVFEVKLGLLCMFSHIILHSMDLLNHAVAHPHRPAGGGTPISLLRAVNLHHILPALPFLH